MSVKIKTDGIELALEDILKNYQDLLTSATEEGLDDAAEIFLKNAESMSPRRTGDYARSWAVKEKKYRLRRYVGNTKAVKGKKSDAVPLINVLEYSAVRGRKHVQKIFNASLNGMVEAIAKKIEE